MSKVLGVLKWIIDATQGGFVVSLAIGVVSGAIFAFHVYVYAFPQKVYEGIGVALGISLVLAGFSVAVGTSACFLEWGIERFTKRDREA